MYQRVIASVVGWLKPRRLRVYPATIALLTLTAWLVSLAMGPGLADAAGRIIGPDFLVFYTGGRFWLERRLGALYDFEAQLAFQRQLLAPLQPAGLAAFVYPPITAILAAPFAVSGYLPGLLAWWVAGLLALAAAVRLMRPLLPGGSLSIWRGLALCALFYPTLTWLLFGQSTAFALLLFVGAYLCLRSGRDFWAGALLGLLLYKPQLAIGLVIVLLVQRRWRALLGGGLTAGVGLLVSLAMSLPATANFAALSTQLMEIERTISWGEHSLAFLGLLLLDHLWRPGAEWLAALLTLGGAAWLALSWGRAPWNPGSREWDLRLASALAVGWLVSPHLYLYDLMLLLLPLAIVWRHFADGRAGRALDGGPVLAWSAGVYVTAFVSSYLTLAQLQALAAMGLPPAALQISVPVILGWALVVWRAAAEPDAAAQREASPRLPDSLRERYQRSVQAWVRWLSPRRIHVYTTAIAVLTAAAWLISQWLQPGPTDAANTIIAPDFAALYAGGRFFLEGRMAVLYDLTAHDAFRDQLAGTGSTSSIPSPFVGPPFAVVAYAPFAALPYDLGLAAWWSASLGALALAVALFRRHMLPPEGASIRALMLNCLRFYPALACLMLGQNSMVSLLLYTACFVLLRNGRDFAAGLALGGLFYKPQLLLGLCLVLLVQRRWRALLGVLASACLWLPIGLAISPAAMVDFVRMLPVLAQVQYAAAWAENSLFFAAFLLLGGSETLGAMVGLSLTLVGAVTVVRWWWSRPWQPGTRDWDLLMSASLALGLLLSPHLLFHDLLLLALPLGILWRYYPAGTSGRLLDGGPLLAWSALVYVAVFAGSYLTLAQLRLSAALGLPAVALAASVPIICAWSFVVASQAGMPRVQAVTAAAPLQAS